MKKSIIKSKTFWFNVLTLALTVAEFLPAKAAGIIIPAGNVALRFVTENPVGIFSESE